MTIEDATVLLSYADVEMDSEVFDAGICKSLAHSMEDNDEPTPSMHNENDMTIKDISTTELEKNSIQESPTHPIQDMTTTDTMPIELINFDVWMVHTAAAVRLKLTQDALSIERGITVPKCSTISKHAGHTMAVENNNNDHTEDLHGFEELEKELKQGLESAYSQSLMNFNISSNANGNPTGMLRSRSQPDTVSQNVADDERLGPLRLKKLKRKAAMQETKAMGNFDGGFGRETPRCLRPGESQHESSSSFAAIEELRKELRVANEGLQHLDSIVAENIQWVHANCDVKGVLEKKGQTLSNRAINQCRYMAAERLSDVFESYISVSLKRAFGRLKQAVKLYMIANTSKSFVRGKCVEIVVNTLSVALRRQYKKIFEPWALRVRWETRWEQEAATVEIQRIVRAFIAKRYVFSIIRELKCIVIQCSIRIFLAKCRVVHAKHARDVHRAATVVKYFVKSRVLIKVAKAKVQIKRENRAALKIQKVFRGYRARQRVRAIRAHIALRNFSACSIQKIYRSKIQSYYAVMERKKFLENQRLEAEREVMRIEAMRQDAAVKIQGQMRRVLAIKRVEIKRHEHKLNNAARTLQRYFRLRVATRFDRDHLKDRRERHFAAIKIQSIIRMRLGKKRMDRRRDDHAKGIPLESEPESYDEDDPQVVEAVVKIQSVVRGGQARELAEEKKKLKTKSKLRLKGRKNSHASDDEAPKTASRRSGKSSTNTSLRKVDDDKTSRPSSSKKFKSSSRPNSSRQPANEAESSRHSTRSVDSGDDYKSTSQRQSRPGSSRHSQKTPDPHSDPESDPDQKSGRASKSTSRHQSQRSNDAGQDSTIESQRSRGKESKPSSRPTSSRAKSPSQHSSKPTSRPNSGQSTRSILSRGLSSFRFSGKSKETKMEQDIDNVEDHSQKKSFENTSPVASRSNSARNKRDVPPSTIPGDIKKPIPVQPKTPPRPLEELGSRHENDENFAEDQTTFHSRPASGKSGRSSHAPSARVSSRPSSSKSPRSNRPSSGKPLSRPTSGSERLSSASIHEAPPPDLQNNETMQVDDHTLDGPTTNKQHIDESNKLSDEEKDLKFDDQKVEERNASEESDVKMKEPQEVENRGRPWSRAKSERSQSPGLLRRASTKLFGRTSPSPVSRSKSLSQSPSRAQAPLKKLKSMMSFRSSSSQNKKRFYKPKDRTLIPRSDDEAATRIQSIGRQLLGYKKVKAKRKEVRNLQKKAGLIMLWAIVTIQRVIRGRIGRWRWMRIHQEYKDKLQKEENERIWKELEEEEERERQAALEKKRQEEELEERNNALWSQYGKAKPKPDSESGDVKPTKIKDPSEIVIPPPTTPPPPLNKPEPLQSSTAIAELDERMRRIEEMEKMMLEKEQRMIDAAKKAEEKAAEMQRAIEAMEKRAAEEEAERQVRRSMMELAAGPMSSMGSSTGPVRSSRPSARGGPMSTRGRGPNSSRPPPSARSAKDGTPRPKEVLKVNVKGLEWIQLWDPDESAWYWWCEATGAAQWDQPSEHGYESAGALTDYSTENDGWNTESGNPWQEYWDEQAQAKYWYNTTTGEASWTPPDDNSSTAGGGSFEGPGDDWVSYIDDATGEEYWYNTVTGETSWSM